MLYNIILNFYKSIKDGSCVVEKNLSPEIKQTSLDDCPDNRDKQASMNVQLPRSGGKEFENKQAVANPNSHNSPSSSEHRTNQI